jgi:dihydroorotate dehydrogenase electron transfer subunit
MYRTLKAVLQPHRLAGKPTIQVVSGRSIVCGLGACLGCIVETRRGPVTSCTHGPVFDLDDLVW